MVKKNKEDKGERVNKVAENSPKTRKELREKKIQKNIEITSAIERRILEMNEGDRVKMTPLAKSLILKSGSSPHVYTIQDKVDEWAHVIQHIAPNVRFLKKDNNVDEIEKRTTDIGMGKELRSELKIIKDRFDNMEAVIDVLKSMMKDIKTKLEKK